MFIDIRIFIQDIIGNIKVFDFCNVTRLIPKNLTYSGVEPDNSDLSIVTLNTNCLAVFSETFSFGLNCISQLHVSNDSNRAN